MPIKINNRNIDTENVIINRRKIGAIISNNKVIMCRHTRTTTTTETPATCTAEGTSRCTCNICNQTESIKLDPIGHTFEYIYDIDRPTCTAPGTAQYRCNVCGIEEVQESGPATGHSWTEQSYEGNCVEESYRCEVCTECSAIQNYESLGYGSHVDESYERVESTCTSQGYERWYCSGCNEEFYREELELSPHEFDETTTWDNCCGSWVCTVCGTSEQVEYDESRCVPGTNGYCVTCGREITDFDFEIELAIKKVPLNSSWPPDNGSRVEGEPITVEVSSNLGNMSFTIEDPDSDPNSECWYWPYRSGPNWCTLEDFENCTFSAEVSYKVYNDGSYDTDYTYYSGYPGEIQKYTDSVSPTIKYYRNIAFY